MFNKLPPKDPIPTGAEVAEEDPVADTSGSSDQHYLFSRLCKLEIAVRIVWIFHSFTAGTTW